MDNQEIWKDIVGYEGKYAVSSMGRVKSLNYRRSGKERILSPGKDRCGYFYVNFYKNGKPKNYTIHRLVLSTFSPCENMENLDCNHLDENKENNNLSNLQWTTHKDNCNHGTRNDKVAEKLRGKFNTKKSIPIVQLSLDGKYIRSWKSANDAEREEGFNHGAIIQCCKNKFHREGNNIYKSFRWMYLSEYMDKYCGIIE